MTKPQLHIKQRRIIKKTKQNKTKQNCNCKHKTNKELYGNLPKITDTLMIRRLRFIGHCWRKKDEVISDLLLWEPKHGARKRGRPALTYVDQLQNDTGLSIAELKNIMENRKEWMKLVNGVRVRSK